ncbi:MAG: CPBP family intramembrane metalloprotease [Acidobacteriales bacterium]|nr:CPBP family intramembrane metalloprotease [Terriglobales bacterium]
MLLKRWENLNNWAFAGVYITCAILTFTTEESQYRRLLAAFTPAGLSVALGSIAAGAYILAGRSIWGVRLGWKHLNVRWLSMSIIVGALLGASVVLLLQMRGGRIRLVNAQTAIPAITVAPIAEELLFRAALFALLAWLFDPLPKPWAHVGTILGAALLFACAHEVHSSLRFLTLLLTGCALGWLRAISGSVACSAVGHTAYNVAVLGFTRH